MVYESFSLVEIHHVSSSWTRSGGLYARRLGEEILSWEWTRLFATGCRRR